MDPRLKKITTRQLLHHTAGWELAQDVMFGGIQGSRLELLALLAQIVWVDCECGAEGG